MSDRPSNEHPDGSDQEKSNVKDLPGFAAFAAMGTTIATCLAVGVVLGLYLDDLWHLAPLGLLIGIVLGTVAAVASVVTLVRRYL
ncbi:MAG TPA: AtpZ/AtpI family protein [Acidimicrobiales bacterium]|nr:AtpZ/AtpI family protein [Acidimicrobiales bacterium]